jgi:hypothetical protein
MILTLIPTLSDVAQWCLSSLAVNLSTILLLMAVRPSMCHAVQGTFVLLPVDEAGLGFCLGRGVDTFTSSGASHTCGQQSHYPDVTASAGQQHRRCSMSATHLPLTV